MIATLFFLLSLLCLRWQLVNDLGFTLSQAIQSGLFIGVLRDLMILAFPYLLANIGKLLKINSHYIWSIAALLIWLSTLASGIYFRFFASPLDWWVIKLHWQDLFVVQGSVAQLGTTLPVLLSIVFIIASIISTLYVAQSKIHSPAVAKNKILIAFDGISNSQNLFINYLNNKQLFYSILALLWVLAAWRVPELTKIDWGARPLNDNVVRSWLVQNFRGRLFQGVDTHWMEDAIAEGVAGQESKSVGSVLAAYRDGRMMAEMPTSAIAEKGYNPTNRPNNPDWPLVYNLSQDNIQPQQLLERLGFDALSRPNIILLFVESLRAYELYEPKIASAVFPRLRKILDEHAIQFTQAYSSSFTAGQTVRGQFSTLCSMLPNILGAATYIAHNTLRTQCLPSILAQSGYSTLWMNSHDASYHGKHAFEALHGTEQFFDYHFYKEEGITEKIGKWGLADQPVLQASLSKLEEINRQPAAKPFFVNLLTISTHHPYTVIDGGKLPEWLNDATENHLEHRAYMSRLKYADDALGDFFDRFFHSDLATNTVVVMLGDHSSPAIPFANLTDVQLEEVRFRIPIAILSAKLEPKIITKPVHQIDIAPTLALLTGSSGKVAWLGHNLFGEQSSPWIYGNDNNLSYRTATRGCYGTFTKQNICVDTRQGDPLFSPLPHLPENILVKKQVQKILIATRQAIVFNLLMPPLLPNK